MSIFISNSLAELFMTAEMCIRDRTRDESVPYFEGIQVKKVVMNEKLPIKDAVLNTAVALSTIFAKNDLQPDYIQLEDDSTIDLIYGDIMVKLGKDKYLEDKMSRMVAILPQITGCLLYTSRCV